MLLKSRFYGSQEIYGVMDAAAQGHEFVGVNAEGLCDWAALFLGHPSNPTSKADIYIVRDGRDVMSSLFHMIGVPDFSPFLRKHLRTWYVITQAWKDRCYTIHYEDLVKSPVVEMDKVASRFDLKDDPWEHSTMRRVGYFPSERGVGQWREVFSEEDMAYFNSVVKDQWTLHG